MPELLGRGEISLTPAGAKIGVLNDPVTRYRINYAGTQITLWDFKNKGKAGWTGKSSFVLKDPLHYLHPSIIYSVPCDRILQRTYSIERYRQKKSNFSALSR